MRGMTMSDDVKSRLYSAWGTMGVVAVFSLLNALIRRIAGPTLSMDDAKTALFTQRWQWGYQPDNPPLFEWLLTALQTFMGNGIWGFLLLKYLGLCAAAYFMHVAVSAYTDRRVAFVTTISAVLLYQIGWNFHQAFTHSALLVPGVLAALVAGLAYLRAPTIARAAIFGAAAGISLLTKYNAALFLVPFLISAAAAPETRKALLNARSVLILALMALILSPHIFWFLGQSSHYTETLDTTLGLAGGYWSRVGGGLETYLISVLTFFLPWGLLALWLRPKGGIAWQWEELILLRTSVIGLLALLAAIFLAGIGNVSERYLIPVLLPGYIAMMTALLRVRPNTAPQWLAASGAFAVLVMAIRIATYVHPGPPLCDKCGEFIPYEALAARVGEVVPEGATLIVREENTGGNMVRLFPHSKVRVFTSMLFDNPLTQHEDGRPCYLIWSEDMVYGVPLEESVEYAYTDPRTVMVTLPWRHFGERRQTTWGITPITDEEKYAHFCTSARP